MRSDHADSPRGRRRVCRCAAHALGTRGTGEGSAPRAGDDALSRTAARREHHHRRATHRAWCDRELDRCRALGPASGAGTDAGAYWAQASIARGVGSDSHAPGNQARKDDPSTSPHSCVTARRWTTSALTFTAEQWWASDRAPLRGESGLREDDRAPPRPGADPTAKDDNGLTPLDWLAWAPKSVDREGFAACSSVPEYAEGRKLPRRESPVAFSTPRKRPVRTLNAMEQVCPIDWRVPRSPTQPRHSACQRRSEDPVARSPFRAVSKAVGTATLDYHCASDRWRGKVLYSTPRATSCPSFIVEGQRRA